MIDLTTNPDAMERAASHCRERDVILPTFAQMKE